MARRSSRRMHRRILSRCRPMAMRRQMRVNTSSTCDILTLTVRRTEEEDACFGLAKPAKRKTSPSIDEKLQRCAREDDWERYIKFDSIFDISVPRFDCSIFIHFHLSPRKTSSSRIFNSWRVPRERPSLWLMYVSHGCIRVYYSDKFIVGLTAHVNRELFSYSLRLLLLLLGCRATRIERRRISPASLARSTTPSPLKFTVSRIRQHNDVCSCHRFS